jgi:2-oxoglutarate dehydrogenase E2 component (dihydrolipoamide succinyltransferase)
MPQRGESIAEGTIVRWIKKVGDTIDRDEPLFEISTDKVDAEIPSPAAGMLTEIKVKKGDRPVNSVVATIGAAGEREDRRRDTPPQRLPRRGTAGEGVKPQRVELEDLEERDEPESREMRASEEFAARAQDRAGTQRRPRARCRAPD